MNGLRTSVLMLLSLSCAIGVANDAPVSERPTVLKQARMELPPWSIKTPAGYSGAHISIMETIAHRLNVKLEFIECPLERCQRLLEAGQADIVIGLKVTPARERWIRYLNPPFLKKGYAKVFYLRVDDARPLQQYEDLNAFRIGVVGGAKLFNRFDSDLTLKKDSADTNEQNFRKLILGRVDVIATPEGIGEYMLSTLDLREKVRKAEYREEDEVPRRIGLSKASAWQKHALELEAVIAQMLQEKEFARIIEQQYFERFNIPRSNIVLQ